ncbi:MAG: DNA mismatch repair protein MutS [Crocinitomicaceae bacterium]|nr:DNA mismatch repair protein MutS [Crocinitomicaceae bacterium]
MLYYDKQTYRDLEFDVLIELLEEFCIGETALERIQHLKPQGNFSILRTELIQVDELRMIRTEGESYPALDFQELKLELKMLPIENASLPRESFVRIRDASDLVNRLLYFFDKRENDYPALSVLFEEAYFTKEIIDSIDQVFDKRGEIKDDASPELFSIRQQMKSVQQQINRNFDRELRKWMKEGYVSDTKETFLQNRRLLAVSSTHKRRIGGNILGASNTGNVSYIEPPSNIPLNNEMEHLLDDERKEIFKILQVLTATIATFYPLIKTYQRILTTLDFINAKCKLALKLDAILPAILEETKFELIDAYHPVLKLSNNQLGKKTMPQSIAMDKFSRMLVISGPNAGGKSITLKTVGLLQLMLQCGLLVPVHPNSKMCFFQGLLTDIGDNQSIENELSTYSYRLKRMNYFLEVANKNTMLLLDEFGTGSDPELGGALAEVFFETLYNKKCFGVITTHYGNIKLKADRLKNAVNGCMLFDTETLQPLFKFSLGQPGSSFTFEVAQINGIPPELIEAAKLKLDRKKVEMDQLLADLQKEKSYLSRLNKEHIEAQRLADESRTFYNKSKQQFEQKLKQLRGRSEAENKFISLGKKFQSFIDAYQSKSRKKEVNTPLMAEVKKYLAVEKSKIETVKTEQRLKAQAVKKAMQPSSSATVAQKDPYNQKKIGIGSTVKMLATKEQGVVEEISGTNVTVAFGFMRLKVHLSKLLFVK